VCCTQKVKHILKHASEVARNEGRKWFVLMGGARRASGLGSLCKAEKHLHSGPKPSQSMHKDRSAEPGISRTHRQAQVRTRVALPRAPSLLTESTTSGIVPLRKRVHERPAIAI